MILSKKSAFAFPTGARSDMTSPQHLGERRFEKRPRCLDAEIAVGSPALARGLWAVALLLVAGGVAAFIALG